MLVRVAACGICGTDIKKIQARLRGCSADFRPLKWPAPSLPVGSGVRRWKTGDRVVSFHHVPCERCFYCDRACSSQCPAYKKVGLTAGF